eukprot:5702396-Pyramimonas_sp.AAC.1
MPRTLVAPKVLSLRPSADVFNNKEEEIDDPELKAFIGAVVWAKLRKHLSAKLFAQDAPMGGTDDKPYEPPPVDGAEHA